MNETDFRRTEPTTTEENQLFAVEDALSDRSQAILNAAGWYAMITASKYAGQDKLDYAEEEFEQDYAKFLRGQAAQLTADDRIAIRKWCEKAEAAAESVGGCWMRSQYLSLGGFYNDHALYVRRIVAS
jgi:hypothetical protein